MIPIVYPAALKLRTGLDKNILIAVNLLYYHDEYPTKRDQQFELFQQNHPA